MKGTREKVRASGLTGFEKAVLLATLKIPRGETRTYSQIARAIGKPKAARAVGNALNKNPFAPQVPCHRVVSKNGIGGYAKGTKKKKEMLKSEGVRFR